MTSVILRTAARFLMTLMLLFSLFLLLRGHNEPGGGFVGGLIAGAAVVLYAVAYDTYAARRALRVDPPLLIGFGLSLALISGIVALVAGEPFMTGHWLDLHLGDVGTVELGTPLFFDIGVYLTVIGVTVTIILSLAEE